MSATLTIGAGLTREERETIIRTSAADDTWDIYTCDPAMARQLTKLCASLGIEPLQVDQWGIRASVPRRCVALKKLVRLTDAERQRRADALRAHRAGLHVEESTH